MKHGMMAEVVQKQPKSEKLMDMGRTMMFAGKDMLALPETKKHGKQMMVKAATMMHAGADIMMREHGGGMEKKESIRETANKARKRGY